MKLHINLLMLLLLLPVCVYGQGYVRMYSNTRDVSSYDDYQQIILRYNRTQDYASAVASLDSVATDFLSQGQAGAYLFHINDAANILLTKGRKQQALRILTRGMEQFSQNSTEMHWEYVCSLILMGYIPNNGHDRLNLLNRQITLMDSMQVDNQAYLHALMNKGRLLMDRGRVKEGLVFCQKARTIARQREDVYSVAIIDFWSLLKFRSKSKSETITELIQLKINELKPYNKHAAIHFYTTLYTYLLAEIYYTDLEQFDNARVALEGVREEILKNPERFFRLSAVCDAMACALEAKADEHDKSLCDSLASEVFRKSEKKPIKYTDRADAWLFLLDSRALSDEKLQILSRQISNQLNQGKDDVLEFLNLKTQVLTQLESCDSILQLSGRLLPGKVKAITS